MKKVLDFDPAAGITRVFHYDDAANDNDFRIETIQETTDIIEENRRAFNDADKGFKGDMTHVARIPLTVFMHLQKSGIAKDPVAMRRWLNDPDNAAFRVKPGVV